MLTRLTQPTVEPLSLAEAKDHLRVTDVAEDAYIATLISVARADAENRLQRSLMASSWRMTFDRFSEALELRMPPVLSIASLSYTDAAGVDQTLAGANYVLDSVSEPGWVVPAFGLEWPATREQINAVRVTYTAGYRATGTNEELRAAVPAPIRQWMLLCIGQLYELRERTVTGVVVNELRFADALLETYRVITL